MNVSLTPRLVKYVGRKVATGKYASASEVIRDALRLMDERDRQWKERLKTLDREIEVGMAQLERGEGIPSEDVFRRLRAKHAKFLKRKA
jgi:antitoxin ParD1/3/4